MIRDTFHECSLPRFGLANQQRLGMDKLDHKYTCSVDVEVFHPDELSFVTSCRSEA